MTATTHDFPHEILKDVAHRPWPTPAAPWVLTQTWRDLLFAHWPVDREMLRARVPAGLPLDLFDGQAWIGIVPFEMTNVAPRATPALPWMSAFPELNVRTYVRVDDKPGVYFFSLDATNPIVVRTARVLFRLPYFVASMTVAREHGRVAHASRRRANDAAVFDAQYAPTGAPFTPERGSLEYFLTERYCLYTASPGGALARTDIHHPAWSLQQAEAEIGTNTMPGCLNS